LIIGGVCVVLGGVIAYFLSKYVATRERMVKLITLAAACGGTFLIVVGIPMPGWAKYLCMAAAGVIAVYCVKGKENYVVAYGTGFVGAVLMMHGISMYAGGFPPLSNVEALKSESITPAYIGYAVGTLVFTVGGGYKQMKKVESDDDDFFSAKNDAA